MFLILSASFGTKNLNALKEILNLFLKILGLKCFWILCNRVSMSKGTKFFSKFDQRCTRFRICHLDLYLGALQASFDVMLVGFWTLFDANASVDVRQDFLSKVLKDSESETVSLGAPNLCKGSVI